MLNLLKTNIMKTRSAFPTLLIASLFCFGCSSQAQKQPLKIKTKIIWTQRIKETRITQEPTQPY